jgi:outer membrane protein TolC
LDLRVRAGRVDDAQRAVYVAADALKAEFTLLAKGEAGERRTSAADAGESDARLRLGDGSYSALIDLDLPVERAAERNAYRMKLIELEQAVRNLQELEDRIKSEVRERLRSLVQAKETVRIQRQAVALAERRVRSTDMLLQAGRAQVRDVLESQEALLNAQNALTAAMVTYRIAELSLQRDLGVLEIDEAGLWREFEPGGD